MQASTALKTLKNDWKEAHNLITWENLQIKIESYDHGDVFHDFRCPAIANHTVKAKYFWDYSD